MRHDTQRSSPADAGLDGFWGLSAAEPLPGVVHPRVSTIAIMVPVRKVLLVDDHELVRVGVKATYPELLGVAIDWLEATCLQDAIRLYGEHPDIDAVLLDLNLPDCKGLQGLRLFLQAHPAARVAVFSGTQDEFVIRQARALGAVGYVGKGRVSGEVRDTLLALLRTGAGSEARPARSAGAPLFPRLPASAMYDRVAELGPRHLEILELVLSGCTNQEISNSTQLSLGTVKNYVSSLLLALDVRSRSHLISLFR
jgi:NarL family two-component system response regulator LiaR